MINHKVSFFQIKIMKRIQNDKLSNDNILKSETSDYWYCKTWLFLATNQLYNVRR